MNAEVTDVIDLQKRIKEREEELRKAATYGKQLLEERQELISKVEDIQLKLEILEQEKYSLQTDLRIQIQTNESHDGDLEAERKQVDNLYEQIQMMQKENQSLQQKVQNTLKENKELEKAYEDAQCEVSSLKAKVISQEEQIKVFQDQPGASMCDSTLEVNFQLENELSLLLLKTKNLENALLQAQQELSDSKLKEKELYKLAQELKEEVDDKDKEIKSYSLEMKKTRDEIADLQTEIEVLKFEQVDVNRRGNSVFNELDDRRKFVEKEYKILDRKYQSIVKTYEENRKEVARARGQIAILSSMTSRDYQQRHIEKLEEDNLAFKKENRNLTFRITKLLKSQEELCHSDRMPFKSDEYDYLRALLQQSEEKVKTLNNEIDRLRMQNFSSKDALSEVRRHLYQVNQNLEATKKENSSLKLQVQEMQTNHSVIQTNFISASSKPNVEILPTKETSAESKQKLEKTTTMLDNDAIPAEFELGEDGFQMKKPRRKSNVWILRELNRVFDEKNLSQNDENNAEENSSGMDEGKKVKVLRNVHSNETMASKAHLKNDRCTQQ